MTTDTNSANAADPMAWLRSIMARLRAPDGCPWDREQTHASLRAGLVEESHEVVEAIDNKDDAHLAEELGDLLLQVVFHSQIASEEGRFDFDTVARGISEKLVRRHPHVFGDVKAADSKEVLRQWDDIKRAEKAAKGIAPAEPSALDGISSALPGLMRAEKVQKKAARVGFDWPDAAGPLEKIREEAAEVEKEIAAGETAKLEDEIGDLLFSVVNLSRKLGVDAELAMHRATVKFTGRFQRMEALLRERGEKPGDLTLADLDKAWDAIKEAEK
ncbi:MAG TPA: nucleoside triphosphate pyrophosphohydrolase [Chthoniobacteraceae bacterium]|nr:nucleoside triphosphate pyrophosphohydrolase [Chthoniobacteraceae bacterium]